MSNPTTSAVVAVLLSLAAPTHAAEEADSLDSLPAPARKTAESIVKHYKVKEVEPAFEDGKKAYEVEYEKDHVQMAIIISAEGKLLKTEQRLSVSQAPEVIKKATEGTYPGSTISNLKKIEKDGVEFFEITLRTADNKVKNLKLDTHGKPLK